MLTKLYLAVSFITPIVCTPSLSQEPFFEAAFSSDENAQYIPTRDNGPHIFNTIHGAMRQWGSSLKHNGMSFFPATIPNNTLLYHGRHNPEPVAGMEWLAFEVEHAEMFARPRGRGGPGGRPPGYPDNGQPPLGIGNGKTEEEPSNSGYLHTYRTSRPLTKLIYVDGMSAGKTAMGTLDTQDLILRKNFTSNSPQGDYGRAQQLCELGAEWGVEGILRCEAGFELIFCNFTDGLEFVSATQRPSWNDEGGQVQSWGFEYISAVAQRYHGITGGRVALDYSSMISAFFYPVNLTNPDLKRAGLPRIPPTDMYHRRQIRDDVESVFHRSTSGNKGTINWQGIVDLIVTRYSDRLQRLQMLALQDSARKLMLSEVNTLLIFEIDYRNLDIPLAIEHCTKWNLNLELQTPQDGLIHVALSTVTRQICTTLFRVRETLITSRKDGEKVPEKVKKDISSLAEYLDWTTWKECGKCAWNEVCFTAIWPSGSQEDHDHPSCLSAEEMANRRGYWGRMERFEMGKREQDEVL